MTSVLRCGRALGAAALSVALLSGGTAGAFAAGHAAGPASTTASISVMASKTSVTAGDTVTFTGLTKGLKVGSPLVLQHEKSGTWIPMKATAKVKNGSLYALSAQLNTKGTEKLRVASATMSGKVYSPTVTVKVS
ncbi:hypothetical protein J2Z21_001432 [Streptomyces griseochromogenes]|uniref:Bacterial Ig domain-containing protein n=1 Tax=Streptomyces griseochromogenes TaxID=68214 RepID=A0A1B1B841_9ACTN|nr:hypothetical protein [Streptomyces griseochromogenes]ANP54902.1 hypothetical protein AVL59_39665 [Streptomyces griseochromogenes]MBP2048507.1 hypothetical protein [Streptomyces griseochromogenes]